MRPYWKLVAIIAVVLCATRTMAVDADDDYDDDDGTVEDVPDANVVVVKVNSIREACVHHSLSLAFRLFVLKLILYHIYACIAHFRPLANDMKLK